MTNAKKLSLIEQARQRITNGESIRSICRDFGIQPQQLRNWFQKEDRIRASNSRQKGTYQSRGGCLKNVEGPLLEWFFASKDVGAPVNGRALVLKAGTLDPTFAEKPWSAKYQVMQRLLQARGITIRKGTRVSKRTPPSIS